MASLEGVFRSKTDPMGFLFILEQAVPAGAQTYLLHHLPFRQCNQQWFGRGRSWDCIATSTFSESSDEFSRKVFCLLSKAYQSMLCKAPTGERMNDPLCVRACLPNGTSWYEVHNTTVVNGATSLTKFIYKYYEFHSWGWYFYLRSCSAFIIFVLLFLWLSFHPFKTWSMSKS